MKPYATGVVPNGFHKTHKPRNKLQNLLNQLLKLLRMMVLDVLLEISAIRDYVSAARFIYGT